MLAILAQICQPRSVGSVMVVLTGLKGMMCIALHPDSSHPRPARESGFLFNSLSYAG